MMDEKQIESLKRRYGSRIADAPKRRRGPERMAVMKGGKPKAGGQTMLRLLSYLKRDRMAMTAAFFCVILGTVTNLGGRLYAAPDHQPVYCAFRWQPGRCGGAVPFPVRDGSGLFSQRCRCLYAVGASCCRWRKTRCSGCGKSCLTICRRFRFGFMIPAAMAI